MSSDLYQIMLAGVQARRRIAEALGPTMGGALGVAADPYPHQLMTVSRILGGTRVRHLIADEVGLGKTVQALMILNALRWQNSRHRAVIVAPDRLIHQWQNECWSRGHVQTTVFETERDPSDAQVRIVRPQSIQGRRVDLDPDEYDLLIVDEPQTMPADVLEAIVRAAPDFRQLLLLSATPGLSDPARRRQIMRMLEPERCRTAELLDRRPEDHLDEMEERGLSPDVTAGASPSAIYCSFSRNRHIVRARRSEWARFVPGRDHRAVGFEPLDGEHLRVSRALAWAVGHTGNFDLMRFAQTLFRSPASARASIDRQNRTSPSDRLSDALAAEGKSPGDSRLDALIDVLSEIWLTDPDEQVVVVAGDNPSIDHITRRLGVYFGSAENPLNVSALRRTGEAQESEADDIEDMHGQLADFVQGRSRILLIGEWVQAGLNLHFFSSHIVFYSTPWSIETIDQLIGRLDRLRPGGLAAGERSGKQKTIRIWSLSQRDTAEAAVVDGIGRLGVFERPLPPVSPADLVAVNRAIKGLLSGDSADAAREQLDEIGTSWAEVSDARPLDQLNPYTTAFAEAAYERLRKAPGLPPALTRRPKSGVSERREEAFRGFTDLLGRMGLFAIAKRRDEDDENFWFSTIWYSGRPDTARIQLPELGAGRNWMSGHQPFIYRRNAINSQPRVTVRTDSGESSGRPIRFLDTGDTLHDGLIEELIALSARDLGNPRAPQFRTVLFPAGHPILALQNRILLLFSAFCRVGGGPEDGFQPARFRQSVEDAPTEAQRGMLEHDIRIAADWWLADQRWLRQTAHSVLISDVSVHDGKVWTALDETQGWSAFNPFDDAFSVCAKSSGMRPMATPASVAAGVKLALARINEKIGDHWRKQTGALQAAWEERRFQLRVEAKDLIDLREAEFQKRENETPIKGQEKFRAGRIASAKRQLDLAVRLVREREDRLALMMARVPETRPEMQSLAICPVPMEQV